MALPLALLGVIPNLAKYWKIIGAGVLAFVIYSHWDSLMDTRDEYTRLLVSVEQIKSDTAEQNKAIDHLKKIGDDQALQLKVALLRANQMQVKYDQQITEMMTQEPPQECTKTFEWMVHTKGDLAWPE